jgi:uncharacterized membrane protein YeaQ/YmgE (transglycosylase-associated protein family)
MPAIVLIVIIGAAAGFIATRLMKVQADVPTTIALGVVGALVGWVALRFVLALTGWMLWALGALLGAVAVIWLWQNFGPSGRR